MEICAAYHDANDLKSLCRVVVPRTSELLDRSRQATVAALLRGGTHAWLASIIHGGQRDACAIRWCFVERRRASAYGLHPSRRGSGGELVAIRGISHRPIGCKLAEYDFEPNRNETPSTCRIRVAPPSLSAEIAFDSTIEVADAGAAFPAWDGWRYRGRRGIRAVGRSEGLGATQLITGFSTYRGVGTAWMSGRR